MSGCLISPENWDCMLENFGTRFGQSRTDLGLKMVPVCFTCVLNCGLGVVRPETAKDFGSKEVEPRLMRGLSLDSPRTIFGTVKNSPDLRVEPKTSM